MNMLVIYEELMMKIRRMDRWQKRILLWYIFSVSMIIVEFLVNLKLDRDTYFHPYISIMINVFLCVDIFFIPAILLIKDILCESKNSVISIFQILLSIIGLGITTIIIFFIFSILNKSVVDLDTVDISFGSRGMVYVEKSTWLETRNHVETYKIDNLFFIRKR